MFTVIAQTRKLQKQCVISFPLHGIFSFFRWYSFLHSLFLHSTSAAAYLSAPGCAACVVHGRMDSRSCSAGDGWSTRKEQFWKRGVGRCVCVWTAGRWGSSLAKLVSTKEKTLGYFLFKNELKQAVLLTNTDILTFGWDADSSGCYCALTCLSHDITN